MDKNKVDFTLKKITTKSKVQRKVKLANRYSKLKVDISKLTKKISFNGDLSVIFLVASTYALIMYSLWFNTLYVNPSTPFEKVVTMILSIGTYALVQYVILEAFKAVGHKKNNDILMQDYKL